MFRLGSAMLFYAIAAVVATWPLVPSMHRALAGDSRSDTWKHAWGCWWFHRSALAGNPFPIRTDLVGFPDGGSLYNIDPLNSLLSIPLQLVLPLPVVYNLLILLQLTAGAGAAWLLCRRVCGDGSAALVGGVVYAFCPFVLSYSVGSGVTETTNLALLPLYLLALLRLGDAIEEGPDDITRAWREPVAAGALMGLTAFGCWYFGMFALVWTALWLGHLLVGLACRVPRGEWGPRLRGVALRFLVLGVVFVDVLIPPLVAFWMSMQNPDSLHPGYISERSAATAPLYLDRTNSVALVEYLQMGKASAVVSHVVDRLVRSAYVGVVVMLLAVYAGVIDTRARFWGAGAALFGMLALGPTLLASHAADGVWPNPVYRVFYAAFPGFTQIAIPFRCCVPLMLACAVLCACGLQSLQRRVRQGYRPLLGYGLALAVLVEYLALSPAPYPLPLAPVPQRPLYAQLRASTLRGVLDLPADWITDEDKLLPGAYFFAQTLHGKPIPSRVSGRMTFAVESNVLVRSVRAYTYGLAMELELGSAAQDLVAQGFDVVIYHRSYVAPAARAKVEAALRNALGAPRQHDDEIEVYFLEDRLRSGPS